MRISLLEHRENFYKILKMTLINYVKEKDIKNDEISFVVNKYLNFVATPNINSKIFQILINEYSNSKVKWKKIFQKFYVKLAVKKWIRLFFSHKLVKLPSYFSNCLIVGGNHRIRLFSESFIGTLVLLKSNERSQYILNDIFIRKTYDLSFAPKILDQGKYWLVEEYFEGIPINRLNNENEIFKYLDIIVALHTNQLINISKEKISIEKYKEIVSSDIEKILKVCGENNCEPSINKLIVKVFTSLYNLIKKKSLEVSWTHGDFQEANILINGGDFRVIDWESADKRFYLYDYFTLFSKSRTNIPFKTAIDLFKSKIHCNTDVINLLLIEEIRFSVNEEFSLNFFSSGKKTEKLCNDILNYING